MSEQFALRKNLPHLMLKLKITIQIIIITVKLLTRFELNCTIRNIGKWGTVEWKHNDRILKSCNNNEIIKSSYDPEMCGYTSTVIIHNFTTANEGYYTCNATHENPRNESTFKSDTVYVLIDAVPSTGKINVHKLT